MGAGVGRRAASTLVLPSRVVAVNAPPRPRNPLMTDRRELLSASAFVSTSNRRSSTNILPTFIGLRETLFWVDSVYLPTYHNTWKEDTQRRVAGARSFPEKSTGGFLHAGMTGLRRSAADRTVRGFADGLAARAASAKWSTGEHIALGSARATNRVDHPSFDDHASRRRVFATRAYRELLAFQLIDYGALGASAATDAGHGIACPDEARVAVLRAAGSE